LRLRQAGAAQAQDCKQYCAQSHISQRAKGGDFDRAFDDGHRFPSDRYELDVMMRSMASKSPQAGDQNSSNAHQLRARRAFAGPVIAILENNPNNFRPVRRGNFFDVELIPFETRAEDGAASLDENV
jgi:hypothetical protein